MLIDLDMLELLSMQIIVNYIHWCMQLLFMQVYPKEVLMQPISSSLPLGHCQQGNRNAKAGAAWRSARLLWPRDALPATGTPILSENSTVATTVEGSFLWATSKTVAGSFYWLVNRCTCHKRLWQATRSHLIEVVINIDWPRFWGRNRDGRIQRHYTGGGERCNKSPKVTFLPSEYSWRNSS